MGAWPLPHFNLSGLLLSGALLRRPLQHDLNPTVALQVIKGCGATYPVEKSYSVNNDRIFKIRFAKHILISIILKTQKYLIKSQLEWGGWIGGCFQAPLQHGSARMIGTTIFCFCLNHQQNGWNDDGWCFPVILVWDLVIPTWHGWQHYMADADWWSSKSYI